MTNVAFEAWQLEQLGHLAASDSDRVGRAFEAFWKANPDLLNDVVLSALDRRRISHEQAASILNVSLKQVTKRLESFRTESAAWEQFIEHDPEHGTVRLVDTHIPVWEVIREYRRIGSVAGLCESFPMVSHGALAAALKYADAHAEEIQTKISAYETYLDRRKAIIQPAAS